MIRIGKSERELGRRMIGKWKWKIRTTSHWDVCRERKYDGE